MKNYHYILEPDGSVRSTEDLFEWAKSFEDTRIIKQDYVNDIKISTIFLGLDYSYFSELEGMGDPILFETMIFNCKEFEGYQERYTTKDLSLKGHEKALSEVKKVYKL